jgi:transposase
MSPGEKPATSVEFFDMLGNTVAVMTLPARAMRAPSCVAASVAVAHQGRTPDVTLAADGTPSLRQGGAAERRIRVEAGEMRQGRKRRSLLIDGSKRHGLRDLDSRLVVAVGVTSANAPEARVTEAMEADLAAQQRTRAELPIDRADLASPLVQYRSPVLAMFCKAWPVQQGPYVPKSAFPLDWERRGLQCPGGEIMPFEPGEVVKFPAATCAGCTLRERGTTSASGRSVSIHPDEALLEELRERPRTPQGRAKLRGRVAVEYALAHMGHWQGRRPAIAACGRMYLICGGVLSFITYTC